MMLGELGVSAKTNLVKVQCLFDQIDKDGSGDIDGDELTRAYPHTFFEFAVLFMAPVVFMWDNAVHRWEDYCKVCVHTVTVEQILKQKISKDVKKQLVKRFDKNEDGKISPAEFISKVVPNPMATLYAYRPSNVSI